MQGIEINKKHKYNLGSALALVVGNVVGAGIFIKNTSIIKNTGSVTLTAMTWVTGGIIIIAVALAILEIISGKRNDSNGGVVGWATAFVNHRFGRTVMWFMHWIYLPIMIMSLAYYGAYYTLPTLGVDVADPNSVWITMAITITYILLFGFINALTFKPGNVIQMMAIILTLIPLIIIIIFGLCGNNASNIAHAHTYLHSKGATSIIISLPAVLFAFDGFYYVTNIKSDLKNPSRNLGLSLFFGLLFVAVLYVLISLAIFSVDLSKSNNQGNAIEFSKIVFNKYFNYFVDLCIVMGALGGLNGYILSGGRMIRHGARYNLLPLKKQLVKSTKIDTPHVATFMLMVLSIVFACFAFLFGYFSHINGPQRGVFNFINDLSNWQTLIIFIFIGVIIFGAIINRFTKKIEVDKKWFFWPAAITAVVALSFVPIWNIVSTIIGASKPGENRSQDIILLVLLLTFLLVIIIGAFWEKIYKLVSKHEYGEKEWGN